MAKNKAAETCDMAPIQLGPIVVLDAGSTRDKVKKGKPEMNLRTYARGKECQIRLPGCLPGEETVSLCHIRTPTTGGSQKEHDLLGAWGCESCHAIVDGRKMLHKWDKKDIEIAFHEAIVRTQKELIERGIVKW